MLKTWITRAATACAAMGLVVGVSGSAQAADAVLSINGGYMKHHDADPDSFSVCDNKVDGYGVTGKLYVFINTDWVLLKSEDDGGDAGCDSFTFDLSNSLYMWTISRHGGGDYNSAHLRE